MVCISVSFLIVVFQTHAGDGRSPLVGIVNAKLITQAMVLTGIGALFTLPADYEPGWSNTSGNDSTLIIGQGMLLNMSSQNRYLVCSLHPGYLFLFCRLSLPVHLSYERKS